MLALVGQGLNNEEIGTALFLSPLTAKTHVSRIMSKLLAREVLPALKSPDRADHPV